MIKKLKSLTALVFAFGFLFAVATTSCGDKKADGESEDAAVEEVMEETPEHPAEGSEHPAEEGEGEHPTEGGEHPSN